MKKKLSIICFSGEFDKAFSVFTLASGSAAINYEVNLFFTFWGFNIIKKKKNRSFIGKGLVFKFFNFLSGSLKTLPMSRLNLLGFSPKLMTFFIKKRNIATLDELIQASTALGVNFYACETSMTMLGLQKFDFIPELKGIVGVTTFLELASDGQILFI